jgi:hypothetical protein
VCKGAGTRVNSAAKLRTVPNAWMLFLLDAPCQCEFYGTNNDPNFSNRVFSLKAIIEAIVRVAKLIGRWSCYRRGDSGNMLGVQVRGP